MSLTTSVGLVGCGRWGKNILRDLVSLGCAVHVVARSEESNRRATAGGATSLATSVGDLPEVDGYIVAVPTSIHSQVVIELLDRSRPIFVEKPMALNTQTAERLAVERHVFVMDKWRYHPGVEVLADLTKSGGFGRLLTINSTRHSRFNPHRDVDAVWILAPHDLSIVYEILGRLPPAVSAVGRSDGLEASLIGVIADEVQAIIDVSSRTHVFRREVRVAYECAVAVLSGGYADAVQVLVSEPGEEPTEQSIPISGDLPLMLELEAFVKHLAGGPPPRSSAETGAEIVQRIGELRTLAGI